MKKRRMTRGNLHTILLHSALSFEGILGMTACLRRGYGKENERRRYARYLWRRKKERVFEQNSGTHLCEIFYVYHYVTHCGQKIGRRYVGGERHVIRNILFLSYTPFYYRSHSPLRVVETAATKSNKRESAWKIEIGQRNHTFIKCPRREITVLFTRLCSDYSH